MAIRVRRHRLLAAGTDVWRGWSTAALVTCIAVLLPLTTFLVSAWLLGWQLQSVQSGSMSPTYPVGALLVVGAIDATDVTTGMPIVFEDPKSPGHLVVHRVIAVAPGESLQFITQGDANPARDSAPVPARMVRGRVLWQVSRLGTTLDWLQWPRSFLILVVVPGLVLLVDGWRVRRVRPEESPRLDAGSPKVA